MMKQFCKLQALLRELYPAEVVYSGIMNTLGARYYREEERRGERVNTFKFRCLKMMKVVLSFTRQFSTLTQTQQIRQRHRLLQLLYKPRIVWQYNNCPTGITKTCVGITVYRHFSVLPGYVRSTTPASKKKIISDSSFAANNVAEVVRNTEFFTHDQWLEFETKSTEDGKLDINVFEGTTMKECLLGNKFILAKSFFDYLKKSKRNAHFVTLSCYMNLCGKNVSVSGQDLIVQLYEELQTKLTTIDSCTLENVVSGLSATDRWKETLQLVKKSEEKGIPVTHQTVGSIAIAAFAKGEYEMGFSLLKKIKVSGEAFSSVAEALIKASEKEVITSSEDVGFQIMKTFIKNLHDNGREISEPVVTLIKEIFDRQIFKNWTSKITTVEKSNGHCNCCGHHLEQNMPLTQEEFEDLRRIFLQKLVIGQDLYRNSNPEEMKRLHQFLQTVGPYDLVVDGLNVALRHLRKATNMEKTEQLHAALVSLTRRHNKKVLLFGRKHMMNWPKRFMNKITAMVPCFFVENVSNDDVFLLYAVLHGGMGTCLISNDEMTNHAHLLKDSQLDSYFIRYMRDHRLEFNETSWFDRVYDIQASCGFNPVAQMSEDRWHIPFQPTVPRTTRNGIVITDPLWLCLRKV